MNTMKQAVDEVFVMDYDNIPGKGPLMMFRKWGDGTMSLATPDHVYEFIENSAFMSAVRELRYVREKDTDGLTLAVDKLIALLPEEAAS